MRAVVVALLLLLPTTAVGQECPDTFTPIQDALVTCSWTDDPIVAGQTPLKAEHINEIRQCANALSQLPNSAVVRELQACLSDMIRWRDTTPMSTCSPPWTRQGIGEDIFDLPPCVRRVRFEAEATDYVVFVIALYVEETSEWIRFRSHTLYDGDRYDAFFVLTGVLAVQVLPTHGGGLRWAFESVSSE